MKLKFVARERCPGCGTPEFETLYEVSLSDERLKQFFADSYPQVSLSFDDEAILSYCVCSCCDLVFQRCILDETSADYLYEIAISPSASYKKKVEADFQKFDDLNYQVFRCSAFLNKKPSRCSVLDYGCGWGMWARMALAHGYNVYGAELSKSRSVFSSKFGVQILETEALAGRTFDLIYCNQVLEHVPKPRELLHFFNQVLNPGGVLYIGVPNGSWDMMRLKKGRWVARKGSVQPLEHINTFTRKSLLRLVEEVGFRAHPPKMVCRHQFPVGLVKGASRYLRDRFWDCNFFLRKGDF